MDPYFAGLLVGIIFGGAGGVFALALVSHGRNGDMERDASRFQALQEHASLVSSDDGGSQASLTELADSIRSGRVRRELA